MVNHPNRSLRAKLKRDGDRYIVSNGLGDRLGFIRRYYPTSRIRRGRSSVVSRWNAVYTTMAKSRDFPTRADAIEWLDTLPFDEG